MKCRRFCGTLTYQSSSLKVSDSVSITDQAKVPIVAPASSDPIASSTEARRTLRMRLWDQTSVRQNLSSNLVTRGLSALISLACVPIYLRVLGVSGYGLIGVWTMLETFANLLDLGLSPTMTRQMAAASSSVEAAQDARDLVRTLEVFYWMIGLMLGGAIILASPFLATHWLNSNQFSTHDLRKIMVLIGLLIFSRWPLSFYGGGISGLERQVLISGVSLAFGIVQALGAASILLWVSPTIYTFFEWQIAVNLSLTGTLAILLRQCLPKGKSYWRPELLKAIRRFAFGITGVAIVSIVLSDLDQLVVSAMLPLEVFGYYSLGSKVASTLYMVATPLFGAVFPAFVRLRAAGETQKLSILYHRASGMLSILVWPAAITLVLFAKPVMFAWTGNMQTAERTYLIVELLTAGTALHCMAHVPWALQLACGWTSLAFWSNAVSVLATVPLLFFLTNRFGSVGAAIVWPLVALGFLLVQVPLMHRRLLKGEFLRWIFYDVGFPLFGNLFLASVLSGATASLQETRLGAFLVTLASGVILMLVAIVIVPETRSILRAKYDHFMYPAPV
jgi:O-antigen/teichoic acid export membrane protein